MKKLLEYLYGRVEALKALGYSEENHGRLMEINSTITEAERLNALEPDDMISLSDLQEGINMMNSNGIAPGNHDAGEEYVRKTIEALGG